MFRPFPHAFRAIGSLQKKPFNTHRLRSGSVQCILSELLRYDRFPAARVLSAGALRIESFSLSESTLAYRRLFVQMTSIGRAATPRKRKA